MGQGEEERDEQIREHGRPNQTDASPTG